MHLAFRIPLAVICCAALGLVPAPAQAQTNQTIYSNSLQNGWADWSWAADNLANTSPVHSGTYSISVTCSSYTALYIHHDAFDSTLFTNLSFWLNGGTSGGQVLTVEATLSGNNQSGYVLPALAANTWQQFQVSLTALGVADQPDMDGIWIFNNNNFSIPTFYVDDISLIAGPPPGPAPPNPTNSIIVNAAANRNPISSLIYGTAFASSNELMDLNFTMNRSGGNEETTYNWEINAHGKGADYYFESYPDASATAGESADSVVANSRAAGAQALITIPFIGWGPILGPNRAILPSFAISKYGPQTGFDPYFTNAGNGVSVTNNTLITWNNPNDANQPEDVNYQQGYVRHLINTWGLSASNGVRYYCMDNEHSIWQSTHQDIHPVGAAMQEIRGKMIQYASMIKSNDPTALVLGPEEWGWNGYLYSGYDQQWSGARGDYNPADYPDRTTNGGWDYCPWLLKQIYEQSTNTNERLLDYFTLHFYPQGAEYGNDVSTATELLRNRSTRQLWDANYVSESWIDAVVELIPRMKNWVATNYPGTKIGITEYNWGAEPYINGATTQADILGIFGREGLDLATRWTIPAANTPTYLAMKIYRNYDGNHSTFGDTSVSASGPDPDNVAVFAAQRSADGALTIMAVAKYLTGVTPVTISLSNFVGGGTAQVWQFSATNSAAITRMADVHYSGSVLQATLPSQSVTLFVIAPSPALSLQAGPPRSDGQFQFWVAGEIGRTFILQSSTNLSTWTALSTNTLGGAPLQFLLPAGPRQQFYRALGDP